MRLVWNTNYLQKEKEINLKKLIIMSYLETAGRSLFVPSVTVDDGPATELPKKFEQRSLFAALNNFWKI